MVTFGFEIGRTKKKKHETLKEKSKFLQEIENSMGFAYTFNIHNKRQTGDKINPKEHHT